MFIYYYYNILHIIKDSKSVLLSGAGDKDCRDKISMLTSSRLKDGSHNESVFNKKETKNERKKRGK